MAEAIAEIGQEEQATASGIWIAGVRTVCRKIVSRTVTPPADSAALNVQPRQRRVVYEALAGEPAGRSVQELLDELDMAEPDLRTSLRKLNEAGLVQRVNRRWSAVPLAPSEPARASTPDTAM